MDRVPDILSAADPVLFHPKRLSILSLLFAMGPLYQAELQKGCALSWGALATQLKKLETEGYIETRNVFTLKGPRNKVWITDKGRQRYNEVQATLKEFLSAIEAPSDRA